MISSRLVDIQSQLETDPGRWFPDGKTNRRAANQELGRMVGQALSVFDEWALYAIAMYGRYIVANSQDETGTAITISQWIKSVEQGAHV